MSLEFAAMPSNSEDEALDNSKKRKVEESTPNKESNGGVPGVPTDGTMRS